jgi:hypothetical protein
LEVAVDKAIPKRSEGKDHPRRRRGRVFVIGAGVSASSGITVADRILREAMIKLVHTDYSQADRVHSLLGYLYPNFDAQMRNYPNIEDFLNLLEMARRFNTEEFIASDLWSKGRLEEVEAITLRAVTDYIWSLMGEKDKQQSIREFVRQNLRVGDTIITFNWDLTIERALEDYPGDPGFLYTYSRHRKGRSFSLLKPHGSIDWFSRRAVRHLVCAEEVGNLDSELCYYPKFDRAKHPQLAQIPPVIVPPVASKEFKFGYLKRTWRFVFRAVSDATELHIIGYSLPREDQFARLVLRRAIRNNIVKASKRDERPAKVFVVNPDPASEGTFSRLVGRGVEDFDYRQAYFEDYVEGIQVPP